MPERRWRKVQDLDEAWDYEEQDPSYVAPKYTDGSGHEIDGWRPLAAVWHVGGPKPWRAQLLDQGTTSNRDYTTLEQAKTATEKRLAA